MKRYKRSWLNIARSYYREIQMNSVKRKTEEMNEACDFTGGPRAVGEAKCKNLDGLCDVRRMILRYFRSMLRSILRCFSRSICYRKRLTALYVREGT